MALSFSRPDPSSPSAISSATFAVARRGFDQAEVRDLLRMVAAELARLQEREKFLERELKTAQRSVPNAAVALDEEVVARLLGEEATKVLQAAREAATQIKVRAEENAARLVREASEEAQKLREETEVETARRRQDAAADAEAELEMAKQQGREMVTEARAYRERVLGELSRRREAARVQIEQLVDGRDRLLQAFEVARISAVDVIANLAPLTGPSEFVNLAATTGPVPMMVPGAAPPAELDAAEVEAAEVEAQPEAAPEPDGGDATTVLSRPDVVEEPQAVAEEPESQPAADEATTNVVSLFAGEIDTAPAAAPPTDVDSVFAKLRASREGTITERVGAVAKESSDRLEVFEASPEEPTEDSEVDDTPFARRDSALTPVITAGARKLKRVLADEQNEILHVLRGKEPVRTVDAVLPEAEVHAGRYASAIAAELETAALAGAASVHEGGDDAHRADLARTDALTLVNEAIAETLVAPLRLRVERAVADAEGDNGELVALVRAVYREWKTQRIDEHLDDIARTAYGRGALAALVPSTPIRWIVDPDGPACPDAEDNALGGIVPAGEGFPTAHICAPAHAGCRCLIAVDRQ